MRLHRSLSITQVRRQLRVRVSQSLLLTFGPLGAQDSSAITPTSTSSTASTTSAFGSTTSAAASAYTTSTNPSPTSSNKSSNTGAIAGGVAGGIVLVLLGIGGYMIHRRKSRAKYEPTTKSTNREKVDLIGRSPPTSPVSTFNVQPPLKYYVRSFPRVLLMVLCMPCLNA